jgi:Ca2+-transporting ATPase
LTASELYSLFSLQQIFTVLKTSQLGLELQQIQNRQSNFGMNVIPKEAPEPFWQKIWNQINNPLILLLLGSAFVSLLIGQMDDAISITLAVLIVSAGKIDPTFLK